VVDGDILPDITFTTADTPIGGLQTWPLLRVTDDDNNDSKRKLINLHADLRKIIKAQNYTTLRTINTIHNTILRKAREVGADHITHVYSTAPYWARSYSLEVAWGVHVHGCCKKHGSTPIYAQNASPPSTTPTSRGAADYKTQNDAP